MTREAFRAAREPAPENMPYPRDWLVLEAYDNGPSEHYRFNLGGINRSAREQTSREFLWSTPRISWRYYLADECPEHGQLDRQLPDTKAGGWWYVFAPARKALLAHALIAAYRQGRADANGNSDLRITHYKP